MAGRGRDCDCTTDWKTLPEDSHGFDCLHRCPSRYRSLRSGPIWDRSLEGNRAHLEKGSQSKWRILGGGGVHPKTRGMNTAIIRPAGVNDAEGIAYVHVTGWQET